MMNRNCRYTAERSYLKQINNILNSIKLESISQDSLSILIKLNTLILEDGIREEVRKLKRVD